MKSQTKEFCRGFTLLEILIALSIFAITSSALIGSMTRQISQATLMQEMTIAHWVAVNDLNQLRLSEESDLNLEKQEDRLPRVGVRHTDVRMADRDWQLRVDVSSTENEDIHRVTIEVFREQDSLTERSLAELTGVLGRF